MECQLCTIPQIQTLDLLFGKSLLLKFGKIEVTFYNRTQLAFCTNDENDHPFVLSHVECNGAYVKFWVPLSMNLPFKIIEFILYTIQFICFVILIGIPIGSKTWKKLVDHIQHTQNVIIVERGKTKQQSNNSSISSNKEEEHSIQHDANLSQLTSHLHQSSVSIVRGEEQLVVVTTSPSTLTLSNAELTISSTHSLSQPANEMETSKPTTFTTTSTPTITTNKISSQKESSSPYQALLLGYIRILCDLRLLSTLCFHLSVLCLMINSLIFFAVTSDFGNAVHQNVAPAIASLTFICSGLIPLSGTFLEVLLTISQQNATISIHAM